MKMNPTKNRQNVPSRVFEKMREEHITWLRQSKWFNDGINNFRIVENTDEGLNKGRLKLPSRRGVIFITDGIQTRRIGIQEAIPEGWIKGGSEPNKKAWASAGEKARKAGTATNKRWVNNGTSNKLILGEIPAGWNIGRLQIGSFDAKLIRSKRGSVPSTSASRSPA